MKRKIKPIEFDSKSQRRLPLSIKTAAEMWIELHRTANRHTVLCGDLLNMEERELYNRLTARLLTAAKIVAVVKEKMNPKNS